MTRWNIVLGMLVACSVSASACGASDSSKATPADSGAGGAADGSVGGSGGSGTGGKGTGGGSTGGSATGGAGGSATGGGPAVVDASADGAASDASLTDATPTDATLRDSPTTDGPADAGPRCPLAGNYAVTHTGSGCGDLSDSAPSQRLDSSGCQGYFEYDSGGAMGVSSPSMAFGADGVLTEHTLSIGSASMSCTGVTTPTHVTLTCAGEAGTCTVQLTKE